MRVLMLGWEFPPTIVGGMGVACYGLTRGLVAEGAQVTFVLPWPAAPAPTANVRLLVTPPPTEAVANLPAAVVEVQRASAYENPLQYEERTAPGRADVPSRAPVRAPIPARVAVPASARAPAFVGGFLEQVERYAIDVEHVARSEPFDVIHAHDWMAYPAALGACAVSGRPVVCHVHSTEFDRAGAFAWAPVVDIERETLGLADAIIAVSAYTKRVIVERYGVDPGRISVVHNAVDMDTIPPVPARSYKPWNKVVVFVGRLVAQKGPEYFVEAAARVLGRMNGVTFVLAGQGEMLPRLVRRVAELRRGKDILFTGFLDRAAVGRILSMADLFVMTSVSEPFGIAALEAMAHGVPAIIPRAAGVGEVVANVLRVDFWDVDRLADRIASVLRHPPLRRVLSVLGQREVARLTWREAARRCLAVYERVLIHRGRL